jgi:hypothetical protein
MLEQIVRGYELLNDRDRSGFEEQVQATFASDAGMVELTAPTTGRRP